MEVHYIKSYREARKTKVAAYCRVSTDMESQEDSYDLQVKYYEEMIKANPEWEFVGVYSDRGISGTGIKNREGFQKMVQDAIDGKIDLILTKSISRFSRNLLDCVEYVQMLHSNGVEIRFEKEGISTKDPSAFMMFGFMATIAQSESESISNNIKWHFQKKFSEGKYTLGNHILGYSTTRDGKIVINEDAWIIRMAFKLFNEGNSYTDIANAINKAGGHNSKGEKLTYANVWYMVRNEVYVGDRLLQKRPPKNFLTHRSDPNVDYNSYYVTDGHPGIIDRETWDVAQNEIQRRENGGIVKSVSKGHIRHFLTHMVYCGECGAYYRRRWEISKNSRHPSWVCTERQLGKKGNGCKNHGVREEDLLKFICSELGWEWKGPDAIDVSEVRKRVERIIVYDDHLEMIKKTDN